MNVNFYLCTKIGPNTSILIQLLSEAYISESWLPCEYTRVATRVSTKITETGSVPRLFRFIFKTNDNLVSSFFRCFKWILKQPKQKFCFEMNQNKPIMYIETTETNRFVLKWTETNRKCIKRQPKQTDLFWNEPKPKTNQKSPQKYQK